MKEPIQSYFRLGTLNWMSYPPARYDVLSSIEKLAKDPFFTAVEIAHIEDADVRHRVKEVLRQSHMDVCFGAHPQLLGGGLNPNALDEEERLKAEASLMNALEEAREIGACGIAFLSGRWEESRKEEHYAQLVKTTDAVCRRAAEMGLQVELEVFDYDVDKKSLIGPAPLAVRFAEDIRREHENFGLLVDLSHIPITHETSAFVIRTLRPYITHLHYGNAVLTPGMDAYGDMHPCFGYPGGVNDVEELTEYLRVLKEEGFFRREEPMILSMEVAPRPHQDADVILANTKRVLARAWAQLGE